MMSEQGKPGTLAVHAAEEILRTIYGDDLKGCAVTLEQIALPLQQVLDQNSASARELFEVYEKVIEAIHLLSVPPETAKTLDASQLRSLLSERLDMIHSVTQRTIDTTAMLKAQQGSTGQTSV
jgi:hypothetical protein